MAPNYIRPVPSVPQNRDPLGPGIGALFSSLNSGLLQNRKDRAAQAQKEAYQRWVEGRDQTHFNQQKELRDAKDRAAFERKKYDLAHPKKPLVDPHAKSEKSDIVAYLHGIGVMDKHSTDYIEKLKMPKDNMTPWSTPVPGSAEYDQLIKQGVDPDSAARQVYQMKYPDEYNALKSAHEGGLYQRLSKYPELVNRAPQYEKYLRPPAPVQKPRVIPAPTSQVGMDNKSNDGFSNPFAPDEDQDLGT